jgi:hypothetical protein
MPIRTKKLEENPESEKEGRKHWNNESNRGSHYRRGRGGSNYRGNNFNPNYRGRGRGNYYRGNEDLRYDHYSNNYSSYSDRHTDYHTPKRYRY